MLHLLGVSLADAVPAAMDHAGRKGGQVRQDESGRGGGFGRAGRREPMINAPGVVTGLIAVFVVVQLAQTLFGADFGLRLMLSLAFIPLRYTASAAQLADIPGGQGAAVWSFVTYALVHGGWLHLAVNSVWMLAFGSVLARRLGAWRFLVFSAIAAAFGAGAHLWLYWDRASVLVGASGAISGQMAGAVRLIFAPPGGLRAITSLDPARVRPLSLAETFTNGQALIFLGVWLGLALATGALNINPTGNGSSIAWETHVGGFIAGLLLFGFLDRRPPR